MVNVIQKLQGFIDEISPVKAIEIRRDKTNREVREVPEDYAKDEAQFIEEYKGIKIANNFHYIFSIFNLSACWSYTDEENNFVYGGFAFNGFSEALAQDSDFWDVYNSLNRREPPAEELEFLHKLNWFEKQAWGDDGKFGCFLREPGDFPPRIYFYDSGAYFPMNLSLEEYFDAMIASCAIRGWQYFYIDIPDKFPELKEVNKEKVLAEMGLAVKMLPRLFPGRDFSYQQKRMAEMEKKLK